VAANAHRKLPYQFHYIPDVNFINAFALPGGHVFIGEGLMALMQNEDTLAGVLGHEIEHIDHYHCAERVQIELAMRRIPLGGLVALPVTVFVVGYTKDQELQADREGARLAAAAGYSPLEIIGLFEAFEKLYRAAHDPARNPQEELSRVAVETVEGYFRSHPLPKERIAAIEREVGGMKTPVPRPLKFQDVFLREEAVQAVAEGRYGAASTLATRVLELKPDDVTALKALAEARFALRDYAGAQENYQKLVPLDAVAANEVREFAVRLASEALQRQDLKNAAELAQRALEFEPVSLEAYLVRIRALLMAGDVDAAWASTQQLMKIAPGGQGELPDLAKNRAEQLMKAHDYAQAERLAEYPLKVLPNDPAYLPMYARAAFAAGDFARAADTWLKLFEVLPMPTTPARPGQPTPWAQALHAATDSFAASGDAKRGIAALEAVRAHIKRDPTRDAAVDAELAGMSLFAGDEKPVKRYVDYINAGHWGDIPIAGLDRIGWWHYRAGRGPAAVGLLSKLVGVNQDSEEVILELAWAQLESGAGPPALAGFRRSRLGPIEWRPRADDPAMGLSLASWLMRQPEEAIRQYNMATQQHPEWLNDAWTAAVYPTNVARLVGEVHQEIARRAAAAKTLAQSRR
jgi:tetratricopeptide (TPR) repeat protein